MEAEYSFVIFVFAICSVVGQNLVNPLVDGAENPDPGVIRHDGKYYVVTTTMASFGLRDKFKLLESDDLQTWRLVGHVFNCDTNLPSWSDCNQEFWAPELHIINGKIRLYFASYDVANKAFSVGVATADNITGPYTSTARPIRQNLTTDYIDATVLHTDEADYLVTKCNTNPQRQVPQPTLISAQKLSLDGLSLVGDSVVLIREDLPWEEGDVEGPWFVKHGEYYYLFYSGSSTWIDRYAVGVARSKSPLGPYEKKGYPILTPEGKFTGTGHCSVVVDELSGNHVMIYHAYPPAPEPYYRQLMGQKISWSVDGWPYFERI
ncbi:Xylan 1,3-beta-xylosidase [Halotydeus destructor]|nr:Xylan 1,3-beta-xylosidase [Halotydeus destructor]